jgi:hypothetical protein
VLYELEDVSFAKLLARCQVGKASQNYQHFFAQTVISFLVDHFLSEVMPYEWTGRFYGSFTEKVFKIAGHLAFDSSNAFGVGSARIKSL